MHCKSCFRFVQKFDFCSQECRNAHEGFCHTETACLVCKGPKKKRDMAYCSRRCRNYVRSFCKSENACFSENLVEAIRDKITLLGEDLKFQTAWFSAISATMILITPEGLLVVLERKTTDSSSNKFCLGFVGGSLYPGEDPLDGMIREWCEEINCKIDQFTEIHIGYHTNSKGSNIMFVIKVPYFDHKQIALPKNTLHYELLSWDAIKKNRNVYFHIEDGKLCPCGCKCEKRARLRQCTYNGMEWLEKVINL